MFKFEKVQAFTNFKLNTLVIKSGTRRFWRGGGGGKIMQKQFKCFVESGIRFITALYLSISVGISSNTVVLKLLFKPKDLAT